jgi:hypothetical protein
LEHYAVAVNYGRLRCIADPVMDFAFIESSEKGCGLYRRLFDDPYSITITEVHREHSGHEYKDELFPERG